MLHHRSPEAVAHSVLLTQLRFRGLESAQVIPACLVAARWQGRADGHCAWHAQERGLYEMAAALVQELCNYLLASSPTPREAALAM